LPAQTWRKFMTYAHQNIDLRPIPFIDNPLPKVSKRKKKKNEDQDIALISVLRPKALSKASQNQLKLLADKLRAAPPVKYTKKLVSSQINNTTITQ